MPRKPLKSREMPVVDIKDATFGHELPGIMTQDELEARMKNLETKTKKKTPRGKKELPKATSELWPGESTDLGGFGVT